MPEVRTLGFSFPAISFNYDYQTEEHFETCGEGGGELTEPESEHLHTVTSQKCSLRCSLFVKKLAVSGLP